MENMKHYRDSPMEDDLNYKRDVEKRGDGYTETERSRGHKRGFGDTAFMQETPMRPRSTENRAYGESPHEPKGYGESPHKEGFRGSGAKHGGYGNAGSEAREEMKGSRDSGFDKENRGKKPGSGQEGGKRRCSEEAPPAPRLDIYSDIFLLDRRNTSHRRVLYRYVYKSFLIRSLFCTEPEVQKRSLFFIVMKM
jgi:hypothetical protein